MNKLPGFSSTQNITEIVGYPGTEYSKLPTLNLYLGSSAIALAKYLPLLHRYTVVENPGEGVLGFFWQILLRGVIGVVRKSGGSCFIGSLCGSFSKIFIGGT